MGGFAMMTSRLVVSLIVHDRATGRLAALQFGGRSWAPEPLWTLPDGKVEPGEPADHAAVREAFEETGLICRPQHLRLVHNMHIGRGRDGRGQFLALTFATTRWEGKLALQSAAMNPLVGTVAAARRSTLR
jgi:8-oxo-dGTP pyrophosphatase MutT (NUDIX family)